MSTRRKRPRDTNQLAKSIVDIATGESSSFSSLEPSRTLGDANSQALANVPRGAGASLTWLPLTRRG
jgi:hypothetical protein